MLTRGPGKCTARPWSRTADFLEPHNKIFTGLKRFPFNNFTYFLTLFSKFFSSFPHGTCSLSVSRRYLALDEIYHPFWAAFPSNPTLCGHPRSGEEGSTPPLAHPNPPPWGEGGEDQRDCHPLWCPLPRDLGGGPPTSGQEKDATSNYNSRGHWKPPDFKFELFPLHSPLLGES